MLLTKYRCNDVFPMLPDRGVRTSEQYYGYNTINSSSAATGYQKANNVTVYLFQDMRDENLSLHVVLDGYGNTGSGSAVISVSNLPEGWSIASSDDRGEMSVLNDTTARGNFSWGGPNTDGFSIQGIKDFSSITITLESITKLTTWNICSYTGKTLSLPISDNPSITITKTIVDVDINSLVQPEPPPGSYAAPPDTILNYSPDLKIKQSISATPSNAKIIAFDTLTPPNPFIAIVDDGRGRVVLDGGFPKFYNSQYSGASSYTQLNAAHKYLYNAMNWVADPARVLAGKTSFLLFNDGPSSYDLGTFSTTMSGVAGLAGFSIVQKNRTNYGGSTTVSIPYSEFNSYCGVIVMSTKTDGISGLSDTTANFLKQYRESGGGIIVITDHNVFQATANAVVSRFGASFFGDIDRSPVSVEYLKTTYGIHPLWNNIPGSVYAGASEGNVSVTDFAYYDGETIIFPGDGIHTIYVLIEDEDENFFSTSYSYLINVADPITVLVGGDPISAEENIYTVKKNFPIEFTSIRINNQDTFGVIKKEGIISGEFSVSPTFAAIWYEDNNRISVDKNLKYIEFNTVSPLPYTKISGITRHTAESHPLKFATIMAASRGAELENYWRGTATNIKQIREYSEESLGIKLPGTASLIKAYFDPIQPTT